jgi:hypothetical protein
MSRHYNGDFNMLIDVPLVTIFAESANTDFSSALQIEIRST